MTTEQTASSILARAQADIEFALGAGGARIQRSTFGAMLERAATYGIGEDGRPIPAPRRGEHMPIKAQHSEPGYDLDFTTLARIGRGFRLLDHVGATSRTLRQALEAYHGETGARWGRPYKQDNSGGLGDRDVALFPLTVMGKKWLGALRTRYPLSGTMRDDEVLANEAAMHRVSPTDDMRRARLLRCEAQARELRERAHGELREVAVALSDLSRAIRRTSLRSAS